MSSLKIYYSNPYNLQPLNNSFIAKYLSKDFIEAKNNPNLVIEYVHKKLSKEYKNSPKKILVSGENLYYKVNLFKVLEYITKRTKINFSILNKILPRKLLDIKLGNMRRDYLNRIKHIAKNPPQGEYAIISNDIKGKNILNLPYFLQVKYILDNINKLFNKKKISRVPNKFCCIIISNESAFDRIDFAKKLSGYKKVDIYGKTNLANADNSKLPKTWADNPKFYSQYKFVICFENSFENEYITEKLPNVMLGGAIPIYRGAPNLKEYFNTSSFINFEDFKNSYVKMIQKIIELDKDDKKYLEFVNRECMTSKNRRKIRSKEEELKIFLKDVMR